MADDFKVILTSIIPEITTVHFYTETVDHVKDGHSEVPIELPSIMTAAERSVVAPTAVEVSHRNSYVYIDEETTGNGDPLRVPVKIIEGTSGLVKSVYFASTKENKIVWRKKK